MNLLKAERIRGNHAPPRVDDHYRYWGDKPPRPSARLVWWFEMFQRGFVPNRFWRREGYDNAAQRYGVYIWEYINVIAPLEQALDEPEGRNQ